ncbi:hypothetical protein [Flavobacterium eburneipallidum]|nr:hypothetical protein [Flavobacterium eburneipallidum]
MARKIAERNQPYQSGGNMIQDVTFEEIKYHKAPNRLIFKVLPMMS